MVKICKQVYDKSNEAFDSWDFTLSDFQKYAIESIILGHNTIITAHTGSGKTFTLFGNNNNKGIFDLFKTLLQTTETIKTGGTIKSETPVVFYDEVKWDDAEYK